MEKYMEGYLYTYVEDKTIIGFKRVDKCDLPYLLDLKNESWFGTHTITLANSISQEKWLEKISDDTHCPRNLVLVADFLDTNNREHCTVYNSDIVKFGIFKILNIDWQNRRGEVGWDVYKEFRKRGLGEKLVKAGVEFCFKILNLRRLDAQVLDTNAASIKLATRAGFIQEGFQKNAIFKYGEYVNNILFGLLNET